MYREFFQLDDYPFRLTADTRYFFMGDGHARATAYLNYILHVRDGIGIVIGESGVGKSTVLEHVLGEFQDELLVARIQQTQLTTVEFLRLMSMELGIAQEKADKAILVDNLQRFIRQQHFAGKTILLVVDEAHLLPPDVLEEIRLLASQEKFGRKLINVLLFGQPALDLILGPQFKDAMSQQVRLNCKINPLSNEEIKNYIEYRLWIAGGEFTVQFPADTIPLIMEYTGGLPRLINILCDMTLIAAFIRKAKSIDLSCVQAAIQKLGWKPYCERLVLPSAGNVTAINKPAQSSAVPRLIVRRHERVMAEYLLNKDRILIGRNSRQDILVNGAKVSRFHAQIVNLNGAYFIQDMNSTNGTYVDDEAVSWHPLKHGEQIRIGNFEMEYQALDTDMFIENHNEAEIIQAHEMEEEKFQA